MDARARTVLCVDDDPGVLAIHRWVLASAGYTVLTASSARTGLELFASSPPAAVLLDYTMPEMNGGEIAALMKATQPEIPVLMLSGLPSLPADARSVDAFVTKCQSPEIWLNALATLLASPPRTRLHGDTPTLQATA